MQWGLTFDGVLVVLLITTIGYCAMVNRRLGAIRDAQAAMQDLASELNVATVRAETGLNQLRVAAAEANDHVDPLLQQVGLAATDLDMMCHRAKKLCDRLEAAVENTRVAPSPVPNQPLKAGRGTKSARRSKSADPVSESSSSPVREKAAKGRSHSERALLEALRAVR
jgi:peptidoglycan hydrolase CwlO-like protein